MSTDTVEKPVKVIRQGRAADLDRLIPLGEMFYSESGLPGKFDPHSFMTTWEYFISGQMGAIFLLEEDGLIIAAIGGVRVPESSNGTIQAQELFWFTHPDYRKQGVGELLLVEFERWAKDVKCHGVLMSLLEGLSNGVEQLYLQRGYRPIQRSFLKEI